MRRFGLLWVAFAVQLGGCAAVAPQPVDWVGLVERVRREQSPPPAPEGLSLAAAEEWLLSRSPSLRRARLEAEVAVAAANAAGASVSPVLTASGLGVVTGGEAPWKLDVGVAFTIPLGGRVSADIEHAAAVAREALATVALREREAVQELRLAWAEWSFLTRHQALLVAYAARLEAVNAVAGRLVNAGELDAAEGGIVRVQAIAARHHAETLAGDARVAHGRILVLLGMSPTESTPLTPEVPAPPSPTAGDPLRHPSVLVARRALELADAALLRERARVASELTAGPVVSHDQGTWAVGAEVSSPLPFNNPNRQAIAEANATRSLAEANVELAISMLLQTRALLELEIGTGEARRDRLTGELQPELGALASRARALVDAGELPVLLLERVLASTLSMEESLLEIEHALAIAHIRLSFAVEVAP